MKRTHRVQLFALFVAVSVCGLWAARVEPELSRAIAAGDEQVVEQVIRFGDVDNFDSVLLQAVNAGKINVIKMLLEQGRSKISKQGLENALITSVGRPKSDYNEAIAELLLHSTVHTQFVLSKALVFALGAENEQAGRSLIAAGADPEFALDFALDQRLVGVIELFSQYLAEAIELRIEAEPGIVQELLDRGLDTRSLAAHLGKMQNAKAFRALRALGLATRDDERIFRAIAKQETKRAAPVTLPQAVPGQQLQPQRSPRGVGSRRALQRGHYPVLFLIDQSYNEGLILTQLDAERVKVEVEIGGTMRMLAAAVEHGQSAVIASRGLSCGLVSLAQSEQNRVLAEAIAQRWIIYDAKDTQFTVWLPREYAHSYRAFFNMEMLQEARNIVLHCPPLVANINDSRLFVKQYDKNDLERIFSPNQPDGVLDFIISGHGITAETVAGLPIALERLDGSKIPESARFTSVLSFLSNELNTGVVWVISCSSGVSAELLLRDLNGAFSHKHYNYVLILGSISDKPVARLSANYAQNMESFFAQAAALEGYGSAFIELLKTVTEVIPVPVDVHGYSGLAQVLIPGGIGFKTFAGAAEGVLVAGNVLVATREQEGRPIDIARRCIVLWYPSVIHTSVVVHPYKQSEWAKTRIILQHSLWKYVPVANKAIGYPEFVFMQRMGRRCSWFEHIIVESSDRTLSGVLHFLRDAFCDVDLETALLHDVLISKLEGMNDIRTQMDMAVDASQNGIPESALYELVATEVGKPIVLHDVMVRINGDQGQKSIAIYINYAGSYWVCTLRANDPSQRMWHFERASAPPIEACKQEAIAKSLETVAAGALPQSLVDRLEILQKSGQTKISEVLKKKLKTLSRPGASTSEAQK